MSQSELDIESIELLVEKLKSGLVLTQEHKNTLFPMLRAYTDNNINKLPAITGVLALALADGIVTHDEIDTPLNEWLKKLNPRPILKNYPYLIQDQEYQNLIELLPKLPYMFSMAITNGRITREACFTPMNEWIKLINTLNDDPKNKHSHITPFDGLKNPLSTRPRPQ